MPEICRFCGSPEAIRLGDFFICEACYAACGSCCAGEDTEPPAEMEPVDRQRHD